MQTRIKNRTVATNDEYLVGCMQTYLRLVREQAHSALIQHWLERVQVLDRQSEER